MDPRQPNDAVSADEAPLHGTRVVTLALNVPGPVMAARMRAMGAAVHKVEPPSGDPLALYARAWYDELAGDQEVVSLDLHGAEARDTLERLLAEADVLVTSTRPSALRRMGLSWDALHARFPRLCHVAIVGEPGADGDRAGHDLTYAAAAGLLAPPFLPRTLLADLAGAERALSAALAALLGRHRTGRGSYAEVALSTAALDFAAPLRHGLTAPGGLLGGGLPGYGLYRSADGWIALAALEPHFAARLADACGADPTHASLEAFFAAKPSAEWQQWGDENDIPIVALG